ncbi:AraC family transcriptional regulator [Alkalicoccobacillus porphyridii]|uniref:AraC family transcriptional regulator n=1 Tax=Alkalicoccobacillus porphyridii TaxID=2597270 RepID=A0A554A203_9BACI|nr:AraC family transcriptional regulator [Alkalicoccobacillus porphyridii]TSB47727.1 AraC family transcriptional regulator [Alkalicoccobacillus porphyridii]
MSEEIANNLFKEQQTELTQTIQRYCVMDGVFSTEIPRLRFIRASETSEPIHQIHEPAICIIAQGSKVVTLADRIYQYDPAHYLVVSVDLPLSGEVIEASGDVPYLCLRLDFDPKQIFDLLTKAEQLHRKTEDSQRGLYISNMHSSLLDAVLRLVRLLDTPEDIPILSSSIIQEILYRVLQNEQGDALKQIAITGSHTERVATVIHQIKQDFAQPLRIKKLASTASMSESSLHHHFKQVTGSSPLQFQKQIRLQEARRLMLSEAIDAASASFQVGYESPSQFSREYSRMFGMSPIRDIKRIKKLH